MRPRGRPAPRIREELGARTRLATTSSGPDDGVWRLSDGYVMRIWLAEVVESTPEPLVEHDERPVAPARGARRPWLDADVRIVDMQASPSVLVEL